MKFLNEIYTASLQKTAFEEAANKKVYKTIPSDLLDILGDSIKLGKCILNETPFDPKELINNICFQDIEVNYNKIEVTEEHMCLIVNSLDLEAMETLAKYLLEHNYNFSNEDEYFNIHYIFYKEKELSKALDKKSPFCYFPYEDDFNVVRTSNLGRLDFKTLNENDTCIDTFICKKEDLKESDKDTYVFIFVLTMLILSLIRIDKFKDKLDITDSYSISNKEVLEYFLKASKKLVKLDDSDDYYFILLDKLIVCKLNISYILFVDPSKERYYSDLYRTLVSD